ncbi:MAG: twin-arginine translocase subunit TatC, partial [Nitrospiraceae bacterium]|nr:twin-arginine translocase subunit TatC [Nitrospiraceae bacterium]
MTDTGMPLDTKMPLTEHLGELRKRLLVALTVFFIAFCVCFYYSGFIFRLLVVPMKFYPRLDLVYPYYHLIKRASTTELVFLAPAEAFWMYIKISAIAGLIVSLPLVLQQVWKFISPGLVSKEKMLVAPFVLGGSVLFAAGAAFCYLVVLPFALDFLLTYKIQYVKPMISVGNYMDFCLKFILAFGVVFELPMFMVLLTRMGFVSAGALAKNRKYAILAAFIIAAVLTPTPDAFNQTLMAVAIIVLYEIGIIASRIF